MFITGLGRRILAELRYEPLNPYDLARQIDEPPFKVRAELQSLRRVGLVREYTTRDDHYYKLTDRGSELAWTELQLEFGRGKGWG
jgi:DNA-binding PadR family transcriptional regulator